MNLPNWLTLFRILLIPIIIIVYCIPTTWARALATLVFIVAALTDWLDGYLARKLDQTSKFGAFLDPVADKLMIAIVLVLIVAKANLILAIPAAIIIGREIVVSALREWMAELGKRKKVAVSQIGKIKMGIQIAAIILLLLANPNQIGLIGMAGYLLLYAAAILTLYSMFIYLKAAWPDFDINV